MSDAVLFAFEHTPTQAEFELFARISGDDNPIHVDPAFSARTRFGRTVAHGMMLYALLWAGIRKALPGARIVEQTLMFPNPAFAGDALRFEARREDGVVVLTARRRSGETVCEARSAMIVEGGGAP